LNLPRDKKRKGVQAGKRNTQKEGEGIVIARKGGKEIRRKRRSRRWERD